MVNLILIPDLVKITQEWEYEKIDSKTWNKILKKEKCRQYLVANYILIRTKYHICVINNPAIWLEVYNYWLSVR